MSLHDIGMKHGTDKATFHQYMDFYESHLDRENIYRLLEIGVLNGASLRTWREWLPEQSIVEGWDINPCQPIDGCTIAQVDQTNADQMLENITDIYDLILDDGGHTAEMMQKSFSTLFPYAKTYIIEDLHAPWVGRYLEPNDVNTLDILDGFKDHGWNSPYTRPDQKEYIDKHMSIVDIYRYGTRSVTAILKNNFYE